MLRYDWSPWRDKNLSSLPFSVPLHTIAQQVFDEGEIDLRIEKEGLPLLTATLSPKLTNDFTDVWRFLRLVGIAGNLCRRLRISLSFEEFANLDESQLNEAVRLYDLWETGEHKFDKKQSSSARINFTLTRTVQNINWNDKLTVSLQADQETVEIFGRKIIINGLKKTLNNFVFTEESRRMLEQSNAGDILKLELEGSESAEMIDEVNPQGIEIKQSQRTS